MTVLCIVGMPRSGTSLLTQLLHRCGVNLGSPQDLMPASPNNTDGFWENLRFVRLNEQLLASNGGIWFAPPSTLRATPALTGEAKSIVTSFEGRDPWAWKDPRNAITLPFWRSLLPSMKVVVCVRHPAESASSLVASSLIPRLWFPFYWRVSRADSRIRLHDAPPQLRPRLSGLLRSSLSRRRRRQLVFEAGLELWRVYNRSILSATAPGERIVTHYESVLTQPRTELERILEFAGIDIPPDRLDDAVRAVSPQLRHQRAQGVPLDAELSTMYEQLCREAQMRDAR